MRAAAARVARALGAAALLVVAAGCGANVAVDGASAASTGGGGAVSTLCAALEALSLDGRLSATAGPLTLGPAPIDVCLSFDGEVGGTLFEVTTEPFPIADAKLRLELDDESGAAIAEGTTPTQGDMSFGLVDVALPRGVRAATLRMSATAPLTVTATMRFVVPR